MTHHRIAAFRNTFTGRHLATGTTLAVLGAAVLSVAGIGTVVQDAAAASNADSRYGFAEPFAGALKYEQYAPTELTSEHQLNQPLGQRRADEIATKLGLSKRHVFTQRQYEEFVTGKGVGGDPAAAKLVDESVLILTNTVGRPLFAKSVLASYGLYVNTHGLLESPANADAPTRKVNAVIAPRGYLTTWCEDNGATASLEMLYKSAYTPEVVFGNRAQHESGAAQLVTNQRHGQTSIVGMSMAPPLWIVNFTLIYVLNPKLAADMPAYWAPIPAAVAQAILASPTGQVPYKDYAADFDR